MPPTQCARWRAKRLSANSKPTPASETGPAQLSGNPGLFSRPQKRRSPARWPGFLHFIRPVQIRSAGGRRPRTPSSLPRHAIPESHRTFWRACVGACRKSSGRSAKLRASSCWAPLVTSQDDKRYSRQSCGICHTSQKAVHQSSPLRLVQSTVVGSFQDQYQAQCARFAKFRGCAAPLHLFGT